MSAFGRPAWHDDAACRDMDREQFFPASPAKPPSRAVREACSSCPVQVACMDYALSRPLHSDHGIWAGTTEAERARLRRKAAA